MFNFYSLLDRTFYAFLVCFGCSKEPSYWDGSFEYPQHMFWLRNKKIIFLICNLYYIKACIYSLDVKLCEKGVCWTIISPMAFILQIMVQSLQHRWHLLSWCLSIALLTIGWIHLSTGLITAAYGGWWQEGEVGGTCSLWPNLKSPNYRELVTEEVEP